MKTGGKNKKKKKGGRAKAKNQPFVKGLGGAFDFCDMESMLEDAIT